MPKARRNRQPRDWSKVTNARSHTGMIRAVQSTKVKVTAMPRNRQLKKLIDKSEKTSRQLIRMREERDNSHTSPERKALLEMKISKLEIKKTRSLFGAEKIKDQIIDYKLREVTKKKNMREEFSRRLAAVQKQSEKIVKQREIDLKLRSSDEIPALGLTHGGPNKVGQGGMITYIVKTAKGSRKVKRKWSDKTPIGPTKDGNGVKRY